MDFPIISSLIILPTIGALFILFTKSSNSKYQSSKYVALFISLANFILSIYLWLIFDKSSINFQFVENRQWLYGYINYKVGVDGISILFILLTTFITPICIISVISTIKHRLKDFLIAILIMETLMIGVFCSLDLIIFYLFFEGGLIPMFLIIGIWGGERRVYSAFKFFLYTLLGSVLMLIAIISIYWISGTTDVEKLYEIGIGEQYQKLLWLAFFSSFAVKTPMWPVHTWLPDAHVEAPTAGSVGFVTLGIFTMTQQGIEGSIFQMISHGLVSAALFLSVGVVYDRNHTRLIKKYGGLVTVMPKYGIVFMIFALGSLGLPGTSGFIGEFLILMGTFKKSFLVATIASLGVILGAAYILWMYKRVVFGEIIHEEIKSMKDLKKFELLILLLLAIPIIFFGFYPEPLINSIETSVTSLIDNYNTNLTQSIAKK